MRKIIIGLCVIILFCAWNGWNGRVSRPYVRQSVFTGYSDITTNMTADNAPSPLVTSCCADNGTGYEAWNAFDGVTNSTTVFFFTLSTEGVSNHWIKYDWGTNRAYTITKYTVQAAFGTYGTRGQMNSWNVYGSNPAASRVLLDTRTAQGAWTTGERRTFEVSSSGSYRYYLLDDLINTGSYKYVTCEEIRWFESVWQ